MTARRTDQAGGARRPIWTMLWVMPAALAGLAAILAVFYGIGDGPGKVADDPACRPALAAARRLAPLMAGELAAMAPASQGRRLPDLAFRDGAGAPRRLAEFRGKWLLVNLWATWCAPCRAEMPALDRLQGAVGGARFEVVAIALDARNEERARRFLTEVGVGRLAFYADPDGRVLQDFRGIGRLAGLPTTLLVDPEGCEVAYLPGPADWAGASARTLIETALRGGG